MTWESMVYCPFNLLSTTSQKNRPTVRVLQTAVVLIVKAARIGIGKQAMMKEESEYIKIAKYLAGECTRPEIKEIKNRMDADPEYAEMVRNFQKIWNTKKFRNRTWDFEGIWRKLSREMEKEREKITAPVRSETQWTGATKMYSLSYGRRMRWIARTVAILMVVGLTYLFTIQYMNTPYSNNGEFMKEVVTEQGQRATIQLEEGSRIRLNSGSTLQHPKEFHAEERTVHLSGEAFFEVARDGRPFFVYADGAQIEVLGTEFNVQAYDDKENIQVVVAGGKVAVRSGSRSDDKGAELERGDLGRLDRNSGKVVSVTRNVDLEQYLGWMDYRLRFNDTPMEKVARELERWYGVEIVLLDPGIEQMKVSATFEDETIREVLRVIDIALDLNHDIEGRRITISRNDDAG